MTSIAALVLAHRDAAQVRRLITALDGVPVVLHCDARADRVVAEEMVRAWQGRVRALPRTRTSLSSWSLVRVELAGLRVALDTSSASHIAVMSGADYPLVGVQEMHDRLASWSHRSYLFSAPIPFEPWSVTRHFDGGRWRTAHRFLTRGDDVLTVAGVPLRLPWRRPLPPDLELRASPHWKIYCREDAERLLRTVDAHPDLVRFWRSTFIPEESFVASVLSSPAVTGEPSLPPCYGLPWFIDWTARGTHHPSWLDLSHFEAIAQARRSPPLSPAELESASAGPTQALFARKLDTGLSSDLLDRIDAELR